MLHKVTTKLFRGKYQHKIVLVCAGASMFRTSDMDVVVSKLDKVNLAANTVVDRFRTTKIRTPDDLAYAFKLAATLKPISDAVEIRVESPWISIYTNDQHIVDTLAKLDDSKVKYISSPSAGTVLEHGTIVMTKCDYDYRITLGRTHQNHETFVDWAAANSGKLKLTKSCEKDLLKDRSWGGTYFYITGDNMILMAKMHLGGAIAKIERITKKIG